MNQKTLGERIKYHRKRLGMTQEQLAERMGVSAQAVSKWENNLSCPDISILPELAEVFDISLDALLGREASGGIVHDAEPVEQKKKKDFHFEWEAPGKKLHGILFAVFVLIFAGLLLMNNFMTYDVSWWTLLWTLSLTCIGLCGLCSGFSFFFLIMTLAGSFFLLDAYELFPFDLGWGVLIPAVLIIWGISLLLDILVGKKKRRHFHAGGKAHHEFSCTDGYLKCEMAFGEYRSAVVTPLLRGGSIESSFGNFTVDFSACEFLAPNCRIQVENSFGSLTLLVPERFEVRFDPREDFAAGWEIKGDPDASPVGVLYLESENSFGHMEIKYI